MNIILTAHFNQELMKGVLQDWYKSLSHLSLTSSRWLMPVCPFCKMQLVPSWKQRALPLELN